MEKNVDKAMKLFYLSFQIGLTGYNRYITNITFNAQ